MEALEEVVAGPNKDLFHIVKGKRTKRLRLQSPTPFTLTTHDDNEDDDNEEEEEEEEGDNDNNNNNTYNATPSSIFINTFTDQEEETAKCLILMSKGDHYYNDDLRLYQTAPKFNSKRYIQTTTNSGNGAKAGIYVYECKTCNRTFPSFQALGGHRASHKKPKIMTTPDINNKKASSYFDFSDEDDQPSPSTLYKNSKNTTKTSNKSCPRIHECSYCGAEFTSGQALGGHMRRHRGGANTYNYSPLHFSDSTTPPTSDNLYIQHHSQEPATDHGMSLDLNLPVPHDREEQTQRQPQHNEPPAIALSTTTPKLVDCPY